MKSYTIDKKIIISMFIAILAAMVITLVDLLIHWSSFHNSYRAYVLLMTCIADILMSAIFLVKVARERS